MLAVSQSRAEEFALLAAAQAGVAVPAPVACGGCLGVRAARFS